ncbi:MAG: hypothetical protein L6V93_04675 [Clostridiales bacterium]|nr:MAG: hypothetical protein L6V93_04675 [Clostridiales bacterium]
MAKRHKRCNVGIVQRADCHIGQQRKGIRLCKASAELRGRQSRHQRIGHRRGRKLPRRRIKTYSAPEWLGYDALAPSVTATVTHESINVSLTDTDSGIKFSYGFSDNDTDEPSSYAEVIGNSGIINAPDNLADGEIHEKTIWITASDSKGNTSEIKKIPMKYDRSVTSLTLPEYTDKLYSKRRIPRC